MELQSAFSVVMLVINVLLVAYWVLIMRVSGPRARVIGIPVPVLAVVAGATAVLYLAEIVS